MLNIKRHSIKLHMPLNIPIDNEMNVKSIAQSL